MTQPSRQNTLKAAQAREITDDAKEKNTSLFKLFLAIREEAKLGKSSMEIKDEDISEDDADTLRELGYKLERPKKKGPIVISW